LFTFNPKPYETENKVFTELFFRLHGDGHVSIRLNEESIGKLPKESIYFACLEYMNKMEFSQNNYVAAGNKGKLFFPHGK
jgi:hypothetical protein